MSDLILYKKIYDLLVWSYNKTDGFPKSKRFSIGQRLENALLDLVLLTYRYQYTKNRKQIITQVSAKFDEVKVMFKVCYDTRIIAHNSFAFVTGLCDEIGAIIGGLIKADH